MAQTVFAPWDDPNEKPIIQFKGVTKRFGEFTAIDDLLHFAWRGVGAILKTDGELSLHQ